MEDLEKIPITSPFRVNLGDPLVEEKQLENHLGVILVTLTNNKRLLNTDNFDDRWIFSIENQHDVFQQGFLGRCLKLIPTKILEEYTDLRTNVTEYNNEELICILPIQLRDDLANPLDRVMYLINLTNALSLNRIPEFLRYDVYFKKAMDDVNKFWKENSPNSGYLTQQFMNRRFRNEDYSETTSYEAIRNITSPQRRQDGEYDFVSNEEYRSNLKEAMGIRPLPLEEYESWITGDMVETMFRQVMFFENSNQIMTDLFCLFIKSYNLCHLIFRNQFLLKKLKRIYESHRNDDHKGQTCRCVIDIDRSLVWGFYTLYAEELILGGQLTKEHRSVWNLECASLLPIDNYLNLYQNPYLCLPLGPGALGLHRNMLGLPRIDRSSVRYHYAGGSDFENDFYLNQFKVRGIYRKNRVIGNILQYTYEVLDGLDDQDIYFTGSGAEACTYNNPLLRRGHYRYDQIYPVKNNNKNHPHSDIDLVVFTDSEDVLRKKAEKIQETVSENLNIKVNLEKINDSKYRISHPEMLREIDIFKTYKSPPALLYNYHISTCRVAISLDQSLSNSYLMTSMVMSSFLGFCIDRRWFSSKTSLYDRICKQLSRGIGILLNVYEIQMLSEFIDNAQPWGHMRNLIEVHNFQGRMRYIKTFQPGLKSSFFRSVSKNNIGQFFFSPDRARIMSTDRTCGYSIKFDPEKTKFPLRHQSGMFYLNEHNL